MSGRYGAGQAELAGIGGRAAPVPSGTGADAVDSRPVASPGADSRESLPAVPAAGSPGEGHAPHRLGRRGEDAAAEFLAARGHRILARNWRCPEGELDIVSACGGFIVFTEVKTRTSGAFGGAPAAMGWQRRLRLRNAAQRYLADHGLGGHPVRLDLLAVREDAGRLYVTTWEAAL